MRCGDATQHDVKQLRRENEELKQLVGDLSLEVYRLKTTAIPMPQDATGTNGCALPRRRRFLPRWLHRLSPSVRSSASP